MSQELLKRADEIRAKNKVLEGVKGSGFHDDDRNVARPEMFAAPQRNGLPRIGDHLVPFFDYDNMEQVIFVGPDAEKAMAALKTWYDRPKGDVVSLPGTDRKLMLKVIPRLKLETVDGLPRLTIWLCDWNDVLQALYAEGIGLSGAPLVA